MKITKGKWEIRVDAQTASGVVIFSGKGKDNKTIVRMPYGNKIPPVKDDGYYEHQSNAALIAEAGTVTNETGCTPKQLAEQNSKLLESLKAVHELSLRIKWAKDEQDIWMKAEKAINNATK